MSDCVFLGGIVSVGVFTVALLVKGNGGMFTLGFMCYCTCFVLIGAPIVKPHDEMLCGWQCCFVST